MDNYRQANRNINVINASANRCVGSLSPMARSFSTRVLNAGNVNQMTATATVVATADMIIDSTINWYINLLLPEPNTFRTPISLARFSLRAVARFIKLIHAINKMIHEITESSRTWLYTPSCHFLSRW